MQQTAPQPQPRLDLAGVLAELLDAAENGPARAGNWTTAGSASTSLVVAVPVGLWGLLERNGADFVRNAFVELLGRKPDEGALEYYRAALMSGRMTKVQILGLVRYSPEGQLIGKIVPGLRRRFLLQRSYRLPLLGRILRVLTSITALPRVMRDLQRLEQMAHADHERLDRLERAAAAAGPQLAVRVGQAEVRLGDLGTVEQRIAALEQRLNTRTD